MPRKKKEEPVTYDCVCCGETKRENQFYMSKTSKIWNIANKKVLICKTCATDIFEKLKSEYTEDEALLGICAMLDIPYFKRLALVFQEKGQPVNIGKYIASLNNRQYENITFLESILSSEFSKTTDKLKEEREVKWNREDKRNKKHVLSVVGYDPFEDQDMIEADRKYCYNVLSGYCDLDGVQDDQYKLDSVIEMTNLQLQSHKINAEINKEQNKVKSDETRLKDLAIIKEKNIASITRLSKDNKIGSQYNSSNNGSSNTFTGKIKEMNEQKLNEPKVNLFDIKTCEAMKIISDINAKSIIDKLELDDNEYSKMIATMREERESNEHEIDKQKEEIRLLKNKIESLVN